MSAIGRRTLLTPEIHHRLKRVVRPQLSRPGALGQRLLWGLVPPPPFSRLPVSRDEFRKCVQVAW